MGKVNSALSLPAPKLDAIKWNFRKPVQTRQKEAIFHITCNKLWASPPRKLWMLKFYMSSESDWTHVRKISSKTMLLNQSMITSQPPASTCPVLILVIYHFQHDNAELDILSEWLQWLSDSLTRKTNVLITVLCHGELSLTLLLHCKLTL